MKRTWMILSLLALLALGSCGKPSAREDQGLPGAEGASGRDEAAGQGGQRTSNGPAEAAGAGTGEEAKESLLRLSEVRLTPMQLTAESGLTAEPVALDPLPADAEFEFRWFLNNEPLEEASGPSLEPGQVRKKQWLHCQARVIAGGLAGPWQSSRRLQAQNGPPRIEVRPIEDFSVPGAVSYQIQAGDPDGDPVSYELLSPLTEGIAVDPASGLLTWTLDAQAVERLGNSVEVRFRVKDDEGAGSSASITLNFTSAEKQADLP